MDEIALAFESESAKKNYEKSIILFRFCDILSFIVTDLELIYKMHSPMPFIIHFSFSLLDSYRNGACLR